MPKPVSNWSPSAPPAPVCLQGSTTFGAKGDKGEVGPRGEPGATGESADPPTSSQSSQGLHSETPVVSAVHI